MDFQDYQQLFQDILNSDQPPAPYDEPDFLNYTRLNWTRQQRWLKTGKLDAKLLELLKSTSDVQHWTVISEPWCGDAAHILPFIHRLTQENPLISITYLLRDGQPPLIERYLTRGSRSIPKLIIADTQRIDIAVWGPRPMACQLLYDGLVKNNAADDDRKIALQNWYNYDSGLSFQQELFDLLSALPKN